MGKRQRGGSDLPTYVQGLTSEVAHSLSSLPSLALLSLVFLGLLTFHAHGAQLYFQELGDQTAYAGARFIYLLLLAMICFSAAVLLVVIVQELVFKFQVFFAFLSWLQGMIMVVSLLTMFALITSATFTAGEDPGAFEPHTFVFFGFACLFLSVISVLIHIHFLRLRLQSPGAKDRPRKKRVDLSPLRRFQALWITAAAVIVILNVATLGRYILFTIFAALALFMIAVLPSLPVEMGYSAFLRATDVNFREQLNTEALRQDRMHFLKKGVKWLLIAIIAVMALVALGLFF